MKLSQFTRMAKDALDKRGGVDSVKQDLQEARQAASGHDNLIDKARAAAGAFRQPGADSAPAAPRAAPAPDADAPSQSGAPPQDER